VKKLVLLGAGTIAVASAVLLHPAMAVADPAPNASNVIGVPYAKAVQVLKSQGLKATFGGSFGSDVPQSACIVSQQRAGSQGRMVLNLDCTMKAVKDATADTPAGPGSGPAAPSGAPGVPAAGTPGQGTYGGPVGVPVPVG
jgi:hypothetical protein